jgi:hypothetical protein
MSRECRAPVSGNIPEKRAAGRHFEAEGVAPFPVFAAQPGGARVSATCAWSKDGGKRRLFVLSMLSKGIRVGLGKTWMRFV